LSEKILKRNLPSESTGRGLVQVFTGEGKGKTTAALGCAIRALGHGLHVYIVFFMKGDYPYGERNTLAKLTDVTIASFGQEEFVFRDNIKPEQIKQANQALISAREAMLSGKYDLIILDEVNITVAFNLIAIDEVVNLIKDKPQNVDLILTGRLADPRIIDLADLVTEMKNIKHPFDKGREARRGCEY
jgi:cob(I)alamin adenosyltransferase